MEENVERLLVSAGSPQRVQETTDKHGGTSAEEGDTGLQTPIASTVGPYIGIASAAGELQTPVASTVGASIKSPTNSALNCGSKKSDDGYTLVLTKSQKKK